MNKSDPLSPGLIERKRFVTLRMVPEFIDSAPSPLCVLSFGLFLCIDYDLPYFSRIVRGDRPRDVTLRASTLPNSVGFFSLFSLSLFNMWVTHFHCTRVRARSGKGSSNSRESLARMCVS